MSRLQKPLNERVLWSTGDLILWAELDLLLKDDFGNWQAQTFRVDSATDMTTLPAYDAVLMNIPLRQNAAHGVTHEPTGLPIRSGFIRCRVVGLDQTEHVFPCFFLQSAGGCITPVSSLVETLSGSRPAPFGRPATFPENTCDLRL